MINRYLFSSLLFLVVASLTAGKAIAADVNAGQTDNIGIVTLSIDQHSEIVPQDILNDWLSYDANYSLSPTIRSEFENIFYCPVNKIFCALTMTDIQRQHIRLSSQAKLDMQAIQSYVEDLARRVNRDPLDAKFQITDGKVTTFSESQNGITLDVQKSIATITSALGNNPSQSTRTIMLPFTAKKPEINYGDANNLGITSLIGEGISDFKGSPRNRIHNVNVGANRFNGVLIKPGEEFSFVQTLGEVDGNHGYLPELVIKNNVTEPEFGGGICQVSTTAFRAAIYSGLKITARRNHAYPVSYYNPQGMDATVYVPQPDLKFKNNTPGFILIQTKITGTVLTFDFYGTDDGRKTVVDGPRITSRQPDGSLKATFTQHVFDKDGAEIITDVFNSSYNSPYNYPHPGGPVLSAKPANWTADQWKAYQKTQKDIARAAANKP